MRRLSLLVSVGLSACPQPPCELADCAADCPDVAGALATTPTVVAWDKSFVDALSDELAGLRAGVRFDGPGLVCPRGDLCTTDARDPSMPLDPRASWDVVVRLATPDLTQDGDWEGSFEEFCSTIVPEARESFGRPTAAVHRVGIPLTRGAFVPLVVHAIDPSRFLRQQRCAWRLRARRTDGLTTELTGAYDLSGAMVAEDRPRGPTDGSPTPSPTQPIGTATPTPTPDGSTPPPAGPAGTPTTEPPPAE